MNMVEMQRRIAAWAKSRFGDGTMDRRERAIRVLEEAIELAQAEGIRRHTISALLLHVYTKPVGEPNQEAAGVGVCLLAWAEGAGENLSSLIHDEVDRIEGKSKEHFRDRHQKKVDAGIAKPMDHTENKT